MKLGTRIAVGRIAIGDIFDANSYARALARRLFLHGDAPTTSTTGFDDVTVTKRGTGTLCDIAATIQVYDAAIADVAIAPHTPATVIEKILVQRRAKSPDMVLARCCVRPTSADNDQTQPLRWKRQ